MHARRLRGALARYAAVGLAAVFVVLTASEASAQYDQFVPYYGKNRIKYDHFDWHIYTTDHFEFYYYPEIEPQLERVASYAESAYQQISADLKHDLAAKVPMVLFKTQSEFQQQNIEPGDLPEGVLAFAEPQRDRMVLPLDQPSDELYQLITHELTHVFEFDIIPRSLVRRGVPLWVDEGLADYEAGTWNPIDLMVLRDAALADIVPRMSDFETARFSNARLPYLMGHAAFEFMESKWGKEGIRQFLFALRKSVVGGGDDAYQEAFRIDPDDFDDQFDKYLKERFKPFRDLERPTDYGKDLAPKPEKTPYVSTVSIEPSPSGDLLAVAAGNRKDQELDIILVSSKDGKVIRNLTKGFDTSEGWEHISQAGGQRFNTVPWMAWAPAGDRIAYFVRTEKFRSLVLQNVVTRKVEKRYEISTIDAPESPAFDPTGRKVAFAGLREAVPNLFQMDLDSGRITDLTNDDFAEYAPAYSPDGKFLVYVTRVSGNDKLFKLDLATKQKTQLTFGTHDDTGAHFIDDHTVVFASTASDPNKPVDPEVARNGQIFNVWTLDLQTGELRRYTDTATAALSPVVLHDGSLTRFAFVTYFKGDFGIHAIEEKQADLTVASSDFGAPGPIIDFQAPLQHTLVKANERKKGTFEKMFLDGRPPINVGVTNNGDIFGGTALTFSDVLGDQQFNFYAVVDRAVPDAAVLLREPLAPAPVGDAGLLADAVLLRAGRRAISTTRPTPTSAATRRRRRRRRAAGRSSASTRSTATRESSCRPGSCSSSSSTTTRACRPRRSSTSSRPTAGSCSPTARSCRSAPPTCGRPPSSGSTGRSRETPCASPTSTRRGWAACSRARRPTSTRATTCASAPTACWRCAPAATRAGATSPTTRSSAGTRRCAGTTTCSSSATTPSSATPSCASRSSRPWPPRSACSGASAACSSSISEGPGSPGRPSTPSRGAARP